MKQYKSPHDPETKVSSTASLKDGSISTKGRPDRRQLRYNTSVEMTLLNKQLSVLFERIGTGLVNRDLVEYDAATYEQTKCTEPDALSVLSHELMSPLTLIKGYAATLLQLTDAITEEQRMQYLQGIITATDRIIRLLDNLRDISRFEIAPSNLIVQPTSLLDLLRQTVSEIQSQTTEHVIKLHQFGSLPLVNVDRQRIEQVMTNLLVNAVKYSPQGGDIEVIVWQAHSQHELEEMLGEVPPLKFPCLIVSVTDSGIGIPEEEREHVCERFYRVDNRLTRSARGSGLGLYIYKTIVEAHGGHIWVKSVPQEGSTFSFSLPVD